MVIEWRRVSSTFDPVKIKSIGAANDGDDRSEAWYMKGDDSSQQFTKFSNEIKSSRQQQYPSTLNNIRKEKTFMRNKHAAHTQ